MIRKTVYTIFAKVLTTLFAFATTILSTNYLGAEGVGTINLVIAGVALFAMVNEFIGGGAVVYLTPRMNVFKIMVLSYAWTVLVSVFFGILLWYIPLVPIEYKYYFLSISVLNSLFAINLHILAGKAKIWFYNNLLILQPLLLLCGFVLIVFYTKHVSIDEYLIVLGISYTVSLLSSFVLLIPCLKDFSLKNISGDLRQMVKYGSFVQVANVAQFFNYRLSYYIIDIFSGRHTLGVFSTGTQITEKVWIGSKSMANVQYAEIANTKDTAFARTVTLQFMKISFLMSAILLIFLLFLPAWMFEYVFGKDFGQLHYMVLLLSPGVVAISVQTHISHYFAGLGKHYYNTIASVFGLVLTVITCLWLIPQYHLAGACISASVSYTLAAIYQTIVFTRVSKTKWSEYLISKKDVQKVYGMLKGKINLR